MTNEAQVRMAAEAIASAAHGIEASAASARWGEVSRHVREMLVAVTAIHKAVDAADSAESFVIRGALVDAAEQATQTLKEIK